MPKNGSAENPERDIRDAARAGRLPEYMRTASAAAKAVLYRIIAELVYELVTRPAERRRGHHGCAVSASHLESDCNDRMQDDILAVREDLLLHAENTPIAHLEGWIVARLRAATVNAHRRRRGERGAQQRPRLPLPLWLSNALGHDKWLEALAVEILTWVGLPYCVQNGLWPLGGWANRRAVVTGQLGGTEAEVAAEVETVLAAMRTNRAWFDRYIETPLGRKETQVTYEDGTLDRDRSHLSLVAPHETADSILVDLAATAFDAIARRVRGGEDPRTVVTEVVGIVFGAGDGVEDMDRSPSTDPGTDETVERLLADPATVDRIVTEILRILGLG